MIKRLIIITEEQEEYIREMARKQQINPSRTSVVIRQIIQAAMDAEQAAQQIKEKSS